MGVHATLEAKLKDKPRYLSPTVIYQDWLVLAPMIVLVLCPPPASTIDATPDSYTLPCLSAGPAGTAHMLFVLTDFGVCLRMELWACCSTRQDGFELLVDGARRASGID